MTETKQDQQEQFDCPVCTDPIDRQYCHHEAREAPLAKALSVHFQGDQENWGWFLDDAGALLKDAGLGPEYEIVGLDNGWHCEHAFVIDGRLIVTIGEGGKDCPAEPEVVAKAPEGFRLAVSQ